MRSNRWLFVSLASAVLTLLIGYVARQVLVGVTTAAFPASSLVLWIGTLTYTVIRIHEPVRLMTADRGRKGVLDDNLEKARADLMTETGYIVTDQAHEDAAEQQQRIEETGASKATVPVVISKQNYKMREETFRDIGVLVQAISLIRWLRENLTKARLALSRAAALLPMW